MDGHTVGLLGASRLQQDENLEQYSVFSPSCRFSNGFLDRYIMKTFPLSLQIISQHTYLLSTQTALSSRYRPRLVGDESSLSLTASSDKKDPLTKAGVPAESARRQTHSH